MGKVKNKAGVVAYRKNSKKNIEVLLVSARKHKNSWVFPLGTVEKNESLKEAAARECVEESGYIVEVQKKIGSFKHNKKKSENLFTFYSATVVDETDDYEKDRKRIWVELSELQETVTEFLSEIAEKFINIKLVN